MPVRARHLGGAPSTRNCVGPYDAAVIVLRTSPRIAAHLGTLRFAALAFVGMLTGHDAVFAIHHGVGPERDLALALTAHGYWPGFIALTALVALAGLGTALAGYGRLRRALRDASARSDRAAPPSGEVAPGYLPILAGIWVRLFLVIAAAFTVQENLEHLASGLVAPGLWVLSGPEYPHSLPTLAGVTLLLAAIGAWLRWHTTVLAIRLAAVRATAVRYRLARSFPGRRWALVAAAVAHRWILLRSDAGRAPPLAAGA